MTQEQRDSKNKNFEKVVSDVVLDDTGKYDKQVEMSSISLARGSVPGGIEIINGDEVETFDTTPFAYNQLMSKVGIPATYARKCPVEMLAPHFDYWKKKYLDENEGAKILLRAKDAGDSNKKVRAFLSSRYGIMDNKDVIDAFKGVIAGSNYTVQDYKIAEDSLNVRVLLDDIYLDAGLAPDGSPNCFFAGIHIINGETGNNNARLDLIIHEKWCTNGATRPTGGKPLFSKRHIGSAADLVSGFNDAISIAKAEGGRQVQLFSESKLEVFTDPTTVLANLLERKPLLFTEGMRNKIVEHFKQRPDASKYGVISAITRSAQDYDYDVRLEMERYAGSILDMRLAG